MKKSEMIDEIACVLLAYGTTYPQYPLVNLVELSKEILKMQEEKGMLPPESYNPNMGGFVGSEMGIYENEWEPEEDPVLEFDTVNPKDIETLQKIAGVKDLELEEKE